MSEPLVTVIVPVHNGAPYLQETLQSIYAQTYSPIEIIAVNHGSTDGSGNILSKQHAIRVIDQPHLGNAYARNTGIKEANGSYLAFIDQDDLWHSEKVHRQMDALLQDPKLLFTISHFLSFLSPGSSLPSWTRPETFTIGKPDYSPSSLVARKEAFAINGLFQENLKIASDVDWFFLANDNGLPMKVIPEVLHRRRVHDRNQSQSAAPLKKEMLNVIRNSIKRKRP